MKKILSKFTVLLLLLFNAYFNTFFWGLANKKTWNLHLPVGIPC